MFRDYDKAAVKNAFEKLNIGYTGGNSESAVTENLELPETIDGIAVTWKSDKQETVKNDGTVIRPTDADIQVTLTATLSKGTATKQKTFTVTVFPENNNPSLDDWFDAAIPKELTTDIDLPANYDGTAATAITWTSSNDAALRIDKPQRSLKGCITPDLVDQQVTLTAKLTYNSQSIKKDIPITVKRLTRLEHSFMNGDGHFISDVTDFTGNEITMINEFKDSGTGEIEKHGARFFYTDLDVPNKRFKAQKTYMLSNNGTWVAIGSAEHRQALEVQQKKMPPYRGMTALVKQPIISLRDAASSFYRVPL